MSYLIYFLRFEFGICVAVVLTFAVDVGFEFTLLWIMLVYLPKEFGGLEQYSPQPAANGKKDQPPLKYGTTSPASSQFPTTTA